MVWEDPHGAVDLFVLQSLYSVAWNEKETISLGICFECGVRELAPSTCWMASFLVDTRVLCPWVLLTLQHNKVWITKCR